MAAKIYDRVPPGLTLDRTLNSQFQRKVLEFAARVQEIKEPASMEKVYDRGPLKKFSPGLKQRSGDPDCRIHDLAARRAEAKNVFAQAVKNLPTVLARLLTPEMRPWIRRAAGLGDLAVGSVYIILGVFAFAATLDAGVRTVGFQGALRRMLEERVGVGFLMAIGLGLVADGFWQGLRAAYNIDMADPGLRGYLDRGSWMVSGLIHLVLGLVAVKLAVGINQSSHESELKRWTQFFLPLQFGAWLIMGAGIVTIIIGIIFIHHALRGDIGRRLDLSSLIRPARALVIALGRFGIAARGAVFIVGGMLVVLAAVHVNPGEAHGLGGILRTIESQHYGRFLLAPVALGLIAYGLFELTCARYRRFRIPTEKR